MISSKLNRYGVYRNDALLVFDYNKHLKIQFDQTCVCACSPLK